MSIEPLRLAQIRSGQRGVAFGLYIDVDDEDWEDYSLELPTVVALDREAGMRVIQVIREALRSASAEELSDDASEALSILLASDMSDQTRVADYIESLGGSVHGARDPDLATAG